MKPINKFLVFLTVAIISLSVLVGAMGGYKPETWLSIATKIRIASGEYEEPIAKSYTTSASSFGILDVDLERKSGFKIVIDDSVENIKIDYVERYEHEFEITEIDGTLRILQDYTFNFADIFFIRIDQFFDMLSDRKVVITVPSADAFGFVDVSVSSGDIELANLTTGGLSLKSSSGDININNVNAQNNTFISLSSGDLNINALNCRRFSANSSSGNIIYKNIISDSYIFSKSSSGNITASDLTAVSKLDIYASSGRIAVERASAEEAILKSSSGNITASNITATDKIEIKASSGRITLSDSNAKTIRSEAFSGNTDFTRVSFTFINIRSSSGNISLTETPINFNDYKLSANCSSGRVYFKSENKGSSFSFGLNETHTITLKAYSGNITIN